jgi:hypothetical protein
MSLIECAEVGLASPLDDAGILLHVLNSLGPGHHLFISAVSKAWRDSYERVASVQMAGIPREHSVQASLHTIASHTTLCSAAFASPTRIKLAHEYDLAVCDAKVQRIAGEAASVSTLQDARDLGLAFTAAVLLHLLLCLRCNGCT